MTSYRFKRLWRQFKIGDPVPSTYDIGMVKTMETAHIIEQVPEPVVGPEPVPETVPPDGADLKENKAIRTTAGKVRRK